MNYRFPLAVALAASLAGCAGGGGSSFGPTPGTGSGGGGVKSTPTATPGPTATPTASPGTGQSSGRATATMRFLLPPVDPQSSQSSSAKRSRDFISPGLDKMTFIVDGTKLLSAVELSTLTPGTVFTSSDGNTSVSFTATATGSYYTYVATIDIVPGVHQFGVEILGGNPAIILSEAQATYTLQPNTNNAETLTLHGVLGTFYIECASGPVDSSNCSSSFVANSQPNTGGTYTLTAIGADFDGFPIADQSGYTFDNGPFSVVETDANGVLTLSNNTGFSSPGTSIQGGPSGGFYVNATANYGQQFTAVCKKEGTATVALQTTQSGPIVPLNGETYTTFDPSNNFPTSGNYPGAGTLAAGSKYPGNTQYHNGSNANAVTTLSSISCDANFNLTIN